MTRQGPRKPVPDGHWEGRLDAARAYLTAAQQLVLLADSGQNMNPAVSQIVLCAIAYGDTLTAKRANVVNQQDHASAPRLLREVMGNTLPNAQEARYRRLLAPKDAVQYGAKAVALSEATVRLSDLEEFANWVDSVL